MSETDILTVKKTSEPEKSANDEHSEMSRAQVFFLIVSCFGFYATMLITTLEVVPAQVEALVGQASKGRWLGGLICGGAVLQCFSGPILGALSDRLNTPYGRRRPLMIIACIMLSSSIIGMTFSAPSLEGLRVSVDSKGQCDVDLVARRCRPYRNNSGVMSKQDVLPHVQASFVDRAITFQEIEFLSRDMSDFDGRIRRSRDGNLGVYVVFFLIMTVSSIAFITPYNALVADRTTAANRGIVSGLLGTMTIVGNITGAAVGVFLVQMGTAYTYLILLSLFTLCVTITVIGTSEKVVTEKISIEKFGCKEVFFAFWDPLREHDFRWVFLTRFLMQQGIATTIGFLQYWMSDMVKTPFCWSTARSLAVFLMSLFITAAIGSVVGGALSDKLNRRKPFIIASAVLMSVVCIALAFNSSRYAYVISLVLAVINGVGYGSFIAVDFALVMDVLPAETDVAKDIAVWTLALILPQAIATPIGGILLDVFNRINCEIGLGYIILFLSSSIYLMLSASFTTKIRGVR